MEKWGNNFSILWLPDYLHNWDLFTQQILLPAKLVFFFIVTVGQTVETIVKTNKMDTSTDEEVLAVLAVILALKKKKEKKRLYIRGGLPRRSKPNLIVHHKLPRKLDIEDPETRTNLNKEQYQQLLRLVTPLIAKEDTNMKEAVTAEERMCLTLQYLAKGKPL